MVAWFVKWYEDTKVLHLIEKRVATKTIKTMDLDDNKEVIEKRVATETINTMDLDDNKEVIEKRVATETINTMDLDDNKEVIEKNGQDAVPDAASFISHSPDIDFEDRLLQNPLEADPEIKKVLRDQDCKPRGFYFTFHIAPNLSGTQLLDGWPLLDSAAQVYGIKCAVNPVFPLVTCMTWIKEKDRLKKARSLALLLSRGVPPTMAMKIFHESCEIIDIGVLGSKFGMTMEQYTQRRTILIDPLEALEKLFDCDIFLCADIVALIGSRLQGNWTRTIVEECIVQHVMLSITLTEWNSSIVLPRKN